MGEEEKYWISPHICTEHTENHKVVVKIYLEEGLVLNDDELWPRLVLTINHVHVETTFLQHIHVNITHMLLLQSITHELN